MNKSALVVLAVVALVLGGCARNVRVNPGPDEFRTLPNGELVEPAGTDSLPTPGAGPSTAEPAPFAQASAALGGTTSYTPVLLGAPAVASQGGGFLARLFSFGRSNSEALDPEAEAARLRSLGVVVP